MVASTESDIKIRKGQAWGAFWKMKDVFLSATVTTRLKINIFNAACLSILLYGCESWILTEKLKKSLDSFATNCYRIMLKIKRTDRISNEEVYNRAGARPLSQSIQRRQLKYVGHSLRKPEKELINKYVVYTPDENHGRRGQGKPREQYRDYIGKIITKHQNNAKIKKKNKDESKDPLPTDSHLRQLAKDRTVWANIVGD